MGLHLQFGGGFHQLPEPWQNLSAEHDIRRPLRFAEGSASAIFAEHVIEHVPFTAGFRFLSECRRVLEPGGMLRIGFPDVGRFVYADAAGRFVMAAAASDYARGLASRGVEPDARRAVLLLLTGWHHESAWTAETAAGVLLGLGFQDVRRYDYGQGSLGQCDGHAKDTGALVTTLESTYIEARK